MEKEANKFGFSRKTNVAIAAMAALGLMAPHPFSQTWVLAIAVLLIALTCIIFQGFIDWRKDNDS